MTTAVVGVTDPFGEADPEIVISKAVALVRSHPDIAPVVAQIVRTYIEVLASLRDDYNILGDES